MKIEILLRVLGGASAGGVSGEIRRDSRFDVRNGVQEIIEEISLIIEEEEDRTRTRIINAA
jgi:protein involved in polysaccharide export with SLBB domain